VISCRSRPVIRKLSFLIPDKDGLRLPIEGAFSPARFRTAPGFSGESHHIEIAADRGGRPAAHQEDWTAESHDRTLGVLQEN